jgi:adenylosuccinate lyase
MPHKQNPVTAEKLTGMARLAAGYAAMLQPVDLWDERDISHSSVERVAIPDLMHILFHSIETAHQLLRDAVWDIGAMHFNLKAAGALPYTAWYALELQRNHAFPADEARQGAVRWAEHHTPDLGKSLTPAPTPLDMVQHHPLVSRETPA